LVCTEPEISVRTAREPELVELVPEELVRPVADNVSRDDTGEDCEQHEHHDENEASHRRLVLLEARPEKLSGRLPLDRRLDLGDVNRLGERTHRESPNCSADRADGKPCSASKAFLLRCGRAFPSGLRANRVSYRVV
jgi:hypothetical protein